MDLFRDEVLESNAKQAFGRILLVYPLSNYLILVLAIVLLIAITVFAIVGKYTRHATVQGVLEPSEGVVKLYASQSGVLRTALVSEGQAVRKGDVLLIFANEHGAVDGGAIESELDDKLRARLESLRHELLSTIRLKESEAAALRDSLLAQQSNRKALLAQIRTQTLRVQTAEQNLARYDSLLKSGFMSDIQVQQKREDLFDQQVRLQGMEQSAITLGAEITRLENELAAAPLKEQVVRAQLRRNISSDETELRKQQGAHIWSIIAPCDGVVSSMTIAANQTTGSGNPLVTIVPTDSQLVATVYAPSRALGFIRAGQNVKLRFDAFPYQKFGAIDGTVVAIAASPVRPTEMSAGTRLFINGENSEPLFTIRVALSQQSVNAYGERRPFRPGMQVDADIRLDTRNLYEWVLEPLYSLRGG